MLQAPIFSATGFAMAQIASMTGFARIAGATGTVNWTWEVRSVNGRGLEVRVRTPAGQDASGEAARAALQKALTRGQCQLTLTLTKPEAAARVRINETLLASLAQAVARVPVPEGVAPATMDGLLGLRGVVEVEDETVDGEALTRDLTEGAARLVADLVAARQAEGRQLEQVVTAQVDRIAALTQAAEDNPARQPEAVRGRLEAAIAALGGSGLDPDRLHQEAMLLAGKADVREELDRLRAHVASARELLAAGGAIGRRLDFLAQEFGREANTLCAKANDISLSRIGLDLKAVVEQFREQVQNIE